MSLSQCGNYRSGSDAKGHFLPRDFVAVAAAVPLITDTKAINRRDRFGPKADSFTEAIRIPKSCRVRIELSVISAKDSENYDQSYSLNPRAKEAKFQGINVPTRKPRMSARESAGTEWRLAERRSRG
jgi:hypothetical protein